MNELLWFPLVLVLSSSSYSTDIVGPREIEFSEEEEAKNFAIKVAKTFGGGMVDVQLSVSDEVVCSDYILTVSAVDEERNIIPVENLIKENLIEISLGEDLFPSLRVDFRCEYGANTLDHVYYYLGFHTMPGSKAPGLWPSAGQFTLRTFRAGRCAPIFTQKVHNCWRR